jgi:Leucine rich repeat
MRPSPWTDGYVVAVAWEVLFNYRAVWNRLRDVDAQLSLEAFEQVLAEIEEAGAPVGPETRNVVPPNPAIKALAARLFPMVERARRAVQKAFSAPFGRPDAIWATCRFPRTYMTLPQPDFASPDEVEIIHLGDLPPSAREWIERGRVAQYPGLRVLRMFGMRLGSASLSVDLARLGSLQALDLSQNGLATLPPETLCCPSLEWLELGGNPIGALPDLASLPSLQFLGLGDTRIPAAAIDTLRRARPELEVAD